MNNKVARNITCPRKSLLEINYIFCNFVFYIFNVVFPKKSTFEKTPRNFMNSTRSTMCLFVVCSGKSNGTSLGL